MSPRQVPVALQGEDVLRCVIRVARETRLALTTVHAFSVKRSWFPIGGPGSDRGL